MDSKERLIVLLRYLKDNTDEETEVSAADIRRMFGDLGESVSAPTLRDDIASLQRAKEDIVVREVSGKGTFFKYLGREWSEAELQILIDAISAGQFISRNKSDRLIDKIRMLAGPSQRESLRPCILTDSQVKAPNESTLYTVQTIRTAMDRNKRIRFRHYEYTPDMKSQPKHGGYIYEVSPYAMIWKKDRYYLVGWSEKHGDIARFRIDRMEVPKISAKDRRPAPEALRLEDHSDRIFCHAPAEAVPGKRGRRPVRGERHPEEKKQFPGSHGEGAPVPDVLCLGVPVRQRYDDLRAGACPGSVCGVSAGSDR